METQKDLDPVALSWRIKERPGATTVEFHGDNRGSGSKKRQSQDTLAGADFQNRLFRSWI